MKLLYLLTLSLGLLLADAAFAQPPAARRIAITIDDLPYASTTPISLDEAAALNQALLATLRRHGAKAVGFVNEDKLLRPGQIDAGVALLQAWLDVGMELGNHNFGHVGLWKGSLAQNQDAVLQGEVFTRWLTQRQGAPLRYYRHPYTQTGRDEAEREAFEGFLAAHGYTVAPFTVEHDDSLFACVYERLQGPDRAALQARVADEYDAHLRRSVAVFETMSGELFGRQIPQVLLIHATRLNADTLERSLRTLAELGYRFVPLDEALQDPAYRSPARASGRFGPSWLARWARAQGVKLSVYGQPDPDGETARLHTQLCAR
ncbi:MAG: polysaccharide deacetylase [Roseateles depolymerans]|uniref:Polysaccharide deacetylase n=1 Tax=Roseateles depolymerans TaxID=76731 RepID=A0A2W5FU09_9BURK|nr:MAG: polysaccharide deacetylase [Roseateles depolymerans]